MSEEPPRRRMLRLIVRVRHRDEYQGKPIMDLLLALYKRSGLSGATVLQGVRGFGSRGDARADILGLSVNLPVVIESVEEPSKVLAILPQVKQIVGRNGLITVEETEVL